MPFTVTEKEQEPLVVRVAPVRLTRDVPAAAVIVPPPHEPVRPLGVATTSPAGKVSRKPIPVRVVLPFGFDRVKVSVVLPFSGMLAAPKDLVIVGGAMKMMPAGDMRPVPLSMMAGFVFALVIVGEANNTLQQSTIRMNSRTGFLPETDKFFIIPPHENQIYAGCLGIISVNGGGRGMCGRLRRPHIPHSPKFLRRYLFSSKKSK